METIASNGPNGHLSDDGTARATVWLTAWDLQGLHRTAAAGDQAGADWLMRESAGLGAAPAVEKFALDRLDPIDAYAEQERVQRVKGGRAGPHHRLGPGGPQYI